ALHRGGSRALRARRRRRGQTPPRLRRDGDDEPALDPRPALSRRRRRLLETRARRGRERDRVGGREDGAQARGGMSVRAIAVLALAVACSAPQAPPALPSGIAEMRIPYDAAALRGIASDEEAAKRLDRRREIVAGLNRRLLMPPPDDALVPE